jgi:hypothetical protein
MNKEDIKLIGSLSILILVVFIFFIMTKEQGNKEAVVYYKDDIILTIDLTKEETKEYIVKGTNGDVLIVHDNGQIRVKEENSPRHLCSKQGFIKESYESIICLPNEIVIKIMAKDNLDTIIK